MMYGEIGADADEFNWLVSGGGYLRNAPSFRGHLPTLTIPAGPSAVLRRDQRAARARRLGPVRLAALVLRIGHGGVQIAGRALPSARLNGSASRLPLSRLREMACAPEASERWAINDREARQ